MTNPFPFRLLFVALLTLLLAACAAQAPAVKERVLWPPLPEQPRLEWIKVYYSQDDFPKTAAQETTEKLLGKPPQTFFRRPLGIAADVDRNLVYISDIEAKLVRYYDLTNRVIGEIEGTVFGRPLGMTLDAEGNLYVCDGQLRTVQVFTPTRRPLRTIGKPEDFENPAYVEVNDRLGRIYVSDGKGGKIVAFDRAGTKLFEFGSFGGDPGQFRAPQGMAIDGQDRLFVADQLNARIQVFDADGNHLYLFGERSDETSGFEGPKDLAFDSEGNLHIVDLRKSALLTYSADGQLLLHTGGMRASTAATGFNLPSAIWIGKDDRIYITDSFNKRFVVWQYLSADYLSRHPVK